MKVLDLFSGIGGFSLGLERTGFFQTVAFCETDMFCRRVLEKHWPGVPQYHDVRDLSAKQLLADGVVAEVLCGGFPCTNISWAGDRLGIAGPKSGLWSEYARLIAELRPRWVLVENVAALRNRGLGRVLRDLCALGYDAEWHCIPAFYVGAYQVRDRLFLVAYPVREGQPDRRPGWLGRRISLAQETRPHGWRGGAEGAVQHWPQPNVGRVADGFPGRVDRSVTPRINALGNAIVPQISELLGYALWEEHSSSPELS